ncbi:glutathione S-transferase N-terminal domain-containing protein [Ectopseudomonas mendocina]|uniref:Glutathione S-transferase N-terminal domain-containing protein n=1 Tax=Ectopseudomonas mendocina TaxID=300 RepID=A0ABZ2RIS9_ECTME
MTKPTLLFAPASPFVRKVLVLLRHTGQLDSVNVEEVQLTPNTPSQRVNSRNPAGKIPALCLPDGSTLHDSRVILDYFDHQHSGQPLIPRSGPQRWQQLTLASLADAIADAAILIRYETFLRPEELRSPEWLNSQQNKIERALQQFEQEAASGLSQSVNIATLSLGCALGYLDLRLPTLNWRERFPQLADWYSQFSQHPEMLATQPPI